MATTKSIIGVGESEDRDMLQIESTSDNRLLNDEESNSRFDEAEKVIIQWDATTPASRQPHLYLAAVDDILASINDLTIGGDRVMYRAQCVIRLAMSRLQDQFRHILIRNAVPLLADPLHVSLSLALDDGDVWIDLINPDAVVELKEIANRMVRSGYEKECCQVYVNNQRDALEKRLRILGVEKLSIGDVRNMEWKTLDEKMKKWAQAVKITVKVLLTCEKRLCDQIFSGSDSIRDICFNEATEVSVMQLLNFGEGVSVMKRSSEKLFKILCMYDALADVFPYLEEMVTYDFVISEAQSVLTALGKAATGTFAEFVNNVKNEASRKPIVGGDIDPLTRYVMNYVELVVDCSDTLNSLLEGGINELDALQSDDGDSLKLADMSPIGRHVFLLLSYLESNLEEKSKFYEDVGLQFFFLINNTHHMVQKVQGSELGKLLGDHWVRKRRGLVRQCATSYLRASWIKVLYCLRDEGIGGSANNVSKVALKERFKNFNACFEELYRVQTAWKVSDPQLREELRISISEKVLPAYRSFEGRFASQLEGGRHAGKYIKYTADDLERYVLDLFEGTGGVLPYTRRKR